MGGALAIVSKPGSRRPRHRGALLFGYFLRGEHQKVTRHQAETDLKELENAKLIREK